LNVFEYPDFADHEKVIFCTDAACGLTAILAIHSTVLGPAAGGCRMYPYASTEDALADVLRLSKGMTYKNAVAGLPLGGGKSVIIAAPEKPNKPELLRAFSTHVQSLAGQYWTAIDVGVGPRDADILAEQCDFVFARASQYEPGFNPSNFTAFGGFVGIKAVAQHLWARQDLKGLRVAIQGLGATGAELARRLHEAGAELIVADINAELVTSACNEFGATAVDPEAIHSQAVDVYAPCAMGAVINDATVPEIKAKAVCGLANNQLANPAHGDALQKRGIAYVPDYVVNAGGMMGASTVIFDQPSSEKSFERIERLHDTITTILKQSQASGVSSAKVADKLAESTIAAHTG